MGLSVLINPDEAEGHPKEVFLIGFAYSLLSAGVATLVSTTYASLLMIFFLVIATLPLFFSVIGLEARKDENLRLSEYRLLRGHRKAVSFFAFLFLGLVFGYFAWFFLPFSGESAFSTQVETLTELSASPGRGSVISEVADAHYLFLNNFKLFLISILLSLLFGSGALLVIAWNSSVIAAAMGLFVKNALGASLGATYAISTVVLRYLLHGTLEMAGYFIGGLIGGILFIELIRHRKKRLTHVATDVAVLFVIGTFLLYAAAWVEVGVLSLF